MSRSDKVCTYCGGEIAGAGFSNSKHTACSQEHFDLLNGGYKPRIDKKIVSSKVVIAEDKPIQSVPKTLLQKMNESVQRPKVLLGSTYKIKTPVSDYAMYVTINDIILNQGTEYEERRPYEIFINTANPEHYAWMSAMTRLISAVFRKGGDVSFIAIELQQIFDPRGGYFKKKKFMPSIIAEIGEVIEKHMKGDKVDSSEVGIKDGQLCKKCNVLAVKMMDGCMTCLNCGDSKCG